MNAKPTYKELEKRVLALEKEKLEQKNAVEAMRENHARFKLLFERAPLGYQSLDEDGNLIEINTTWLDILGYSREEVIGKSFRDFLHPDWKDDFKESFSRLKAVGEVSGVEFEMVKKDGSAILVSLNGKIGKGKDGGFQQTHCILHDITPHKQVEKSLRLSEELFSKAFHCGPLLMTISDIDDGNYIEVNENFTEISGYSREDSIGTTSVKLGLISEEDRAKLKQTLLLKGKVDRMELSLRKKSGEKFYCLFFGEIIEVAGKKRLLSIAEDITDRKLAEEALRKSEKKYRTLLETTSEGCWLINPELKTVEVNKSLCKMLGYSRDEMIGKTPFDFVDDENRKIFFEQTSKISGTEHRSYAITLKKKNGGDLHTYFNATTIRDESGEIQGSFSFITDITEYKRTQEELNLLGTAIEQAMDSVLIADKDGTIQYVNPAFERLTGYSRKEAVGQNPRILKSGKQDDLFYKKMWETLTRGDIWQGHFINKKKDGSLYDTKATISPVLDKSGKITNFVSIKRDITSEIALEKQLRQSQKMEAIGTLAGGIAHDFNNALYAIMGYADLTMDDVPEGSLAQRNLQGVLTAANRAKDIIQQILTFSRKNASIKKPIKVQSIVKEAIKLLRTSIPATIEIRHNIDTDCRPVMADPTRIHQVVMNLGTNAYHAMRENGGVLTINVAKENVSMDDSASYPDLHPGKYVKLTVSDTGHGMDRAVIEKIFDPFFTTKPVGEGTGMGLSTVYGIVKSHGGDIKVYSEPGKGTVFHVYLPLIETKPVEQKIESAGPVQKGSEHILLVDDEEPLVLMVKQILERLGYQVTSRTGSVEALEAFRAKPDEYDLVITDMAMPNMSGIQLAPRLLEIRSDIPIILCTGFSEVTDENRAKALGIKEFVMKPVVRNQIARSIRKALD